MESAKSLPKMALTSASLKLKGSSAGERLLSSYRGPFSHIWSVRSTLLLNSWKSVKLFALFGTVGLSQLAQQDSDSDDLMSLTRLSSLHGDWLEA